MLNIVDLERRWVKYKIKSYIPHLIIVISLVVISTILLIVFNSEQITNNKDKSIVNNKKNLTNEPEKEYEKIKEKVIKPVQTVKPIVTKAITTIDRTPPVVQEHKKVQLTPSLDFMRKMQNSMQPYYKNETIKAEPIKKVQAPKVEVVEQKQVLVQDRVSQAEIQQITIQRQNTQNDIFEIIARFKKNSNPALSLFIAKKYYELGDYEQAYNYALITNKINKEIESSWIIFTKSLVKLGKRKQAIATLKQYIKQSHSSAARILLDEIYAGKFQ